MSKILIVFAGLILLSFQCEKDYPDPILAQDFLFAYVYSNYAWGTTIQGWLIDNAGQVRGFSNLGNPDFIWNTPRDGGFISEKELNENFMHSDTVFFKIDLPELLYNYELIGPASKGTLTEVAKGADMGQKSYYCFTYSPEEKQYRFVTLSSTGDYDIENTSPAAGRLVMWMREKIEEGNR
jgi:hypothetical protein